MAANGQRRFILSNSMPRVSVLLPLYNSERYLHTALASLSVQKYSDFEVIAVNDGSTDNTRAILEKHQETDQRVKVIHQTNQGIVAALNVALRHATGEYVARMDGDDVCAESRFAEQVSYLDNNIDCVCVGSRLRLIDERSQFIGVDPGKASVRQTDLHRFPPHIVTAPHPSIMGRTAAFLELGGYRPHFPHAEDFDLFLRLSKLGTIHILQSQLLDYRIHSDSVSARFIDTQEDSAALAILSAIAVLRGKQDLCEQSRATTRGDYYNEISDDQFSELFEIYVQLRATKRRIERNRLEEAGRLLTAVCGRLMREMPNHLITPAYWRLLAATMIVSAKLATRSW